MGHGTSFGRLQKLQLLFEGCTKVGAGAGASVLGHIGGGATAQIKKTYTFLLSSAKPTCNRLHSWAVSIAFVRGLRNNSGRPCGSKAWNLTTGPVSHKRQTLLYWLGSDHARHPESCLLAPSLRVGDVPLQKYRVAWVASEIVMKFDFISKIPYLLVNICEPNIAALALHQYGTAPQGRSQHRPSELQAHITVAVAARFVSHFAQNSFSIG